MIVAKCGEDGIVIEEYDEDGELTVQLPIDVDCARKVISQLADAIQETESTATVAVAVPLGDFTHTERVALAAAEAVSHFQSSSGAQTNFIENHKYLMSVMCGKSPETERANVVSLKNA